MTRTSVSFWSDVIMPMDGTCFAEHLDRLQTHAGLPVPLSRMQFNARDTTRIAKRYCPGRLAQHNVTFSHL